MGLSTFDIFKNLDVDNIPELKVLSDDELHQLQATLFGMLKEIDAFFRKNKINYSLAGGSALGVVRHGGFIPWDDDIDILMPRKDFNRLRKVFKGDICKKYWLHTPEKTKGYGLGIGRIRLKNTVCKCRDDIRNKECGVYIDIFIMENTFDLKPLRYFHGFLSYAFGFIFSCRNFYENREFNLRLVKNDPDAEKIFKKKIRLGKLFSFASVDFWTHCWNNVNSICPDNNSRYVTVPCGRKKFFKETYERRSVCKTRDCDFKFKDETIKLRLMQGVEDYLTKLYGDYMKLPNPEDIEKHVVLELKL